MYMFKNRIIVIIFDSHRCAPAVFLTLDFFDVRVAFKFKRISDPKIIFVIFIFTVNRITSQREEKTEKIVGQRLTAIWES